MLCELILILKRGCVDELHSRNGVSMFCELILILKQERKEKFGFHAIGFNALRANPHSKTLEKG